VLNRELQRCHEEEFERERAELLLERPSADGGSSDALARQHARRRNFFRYDIVLRQVDVCRPHPGGWDKCQSVSWNLKRASPAASTSIRTQTIEHTLVCTRQGTHTYLKRASPAAAELFFWHVQLVAINSIPQAMPALNHRWQRLARDVDSLYGKVSDHSSGTNPIAPERIQ